MKLITLVAAAALLLISIIPVLSGEKFDYDFALRGGTLYLGGLQMGPVGDVAVLGDEIVAVGDAPGRAKREIDASGMVISPGFIDLHTHSDLPFMMLKGIPLPGSVKANLNYITQGVTTVVTGNCGFGFADYNEVTKWLKKIDRMPFGSNVIHLVPHGQIRLKAMGTAQAERQDPKPTPEELQKMKDLLDGGLKAGAWGMSTGLEYDPGARSNAEELVELARVVAKHGGVYASHIRHEGPDFDKMIASFKEAIAIGEMTGTSVQISHIKCSGKPVHGMSPKVIEIIEAARARGVRVYADQYPYTAGASALSSIVPVRFRDGRKVLKKYCSGEGRAEMREEMTEFMKYEMTPENVMVSAYPWKRSLQGKTIAEIAKKRGQDPVDVAIDLACGPVGMGIFFTQNEEDMRNFMVKDWVATGSDGSVYWKLVGNTHPRFYGTFPRKIRRYVYDEKLATLPFVLRSMTELPAESFRIPKRGSLVKGNFADIVVFNPETIRDTATYENSTTYSEGIEYLFVNGVLTIDGGKYTGHRGGRALRHE